MCTIFILIRFSLDSHRILIGFSFSFNCSCSSFVVSVAKSSNPIQISERAYNKLKKDVKRETARLKSLRHARKNTPRLSETALNTMKTDERMLCAHDGNAVSFS